MYESCVIWLSVRPFAPSYRTEPPQAPPSEYGPNCTPSSDVATLAFVPEKSPVSRSSPGAGAPLSPLSPVAPVSPFGAGCARVALGTLRTSTPLRAAGAGLPLVAPTSALRAVSERSESEIAPFLIWLDDVIT